MTGKILSYLALLENLNKEDKKLNLEVKSNLKVYEDKLEDYIQTSKKVYDENEENINDFKTIFNSKYNSSYKTVIETFKNQDRLIYNKGFFLDEEKEAIYFNTLNDEEIISERFIVSGNEIVFFFNEDVEFNTIKAIIKNNDGINIIPKEIIINNSLGNSFFLEDFNRFFEFKENEYDVQSFISSTKKTNSIKFVFDNEMPNIALSTFKFFLNTFETENEVIIKYENVFKKNKLIKLKRNIYDKFKTLKYYISFDGVSFDEFNWSDPELEKVDIEDDVKIINLPQNIPNDIFIKIKSSNEIKINTSSITKKENFIEQIVPKNFIEENELKYKYKLNDFGGKIINSSIKMYVSNKVAKMITDNSDNIIDKVSEPGRNLIAKGFINVEKNRIERADEFFLMDFDSLESLKVIENELGFFVNGSLYIPSLFYENDVYFRVSYDVEFPENSNDISKYTPFIFDLNLMAGD